MSGRRAFIIGEAYGMGLWCVGGFWLYTAIHDYSDSNVARIDYDWIDGSRYGTVSWIFSTSL